MIIESTKNACIVLTCVFYIKTLLQKITKTIILKIPDLAFLTFENIMSGKLRTPYSLKVTLDRFEEDYAIFFINDGKEILWPKDKLPQDLEEGSVIKIKLYTSQDEEKEQRELAKNILNEILNNK